MGIEIILIIVVVLFVTFTAVLKRYKRCPSDKIMVIYGKTGKNRSGSISSARCVHGGASFIWPVFQDYAFLDLKPISIECNLTNALSKQNIRVDVPCRFTVGISTEADSMTNAAERLLGLSIDNIQNIATDILFGQLRLVIATMDIEEINADRDKFLAAVSQNVEAELRKIGLKLINVNVTDIRDESGYIEALGKEAAAKAINDAKKSVAEQNRFGEIGKAEADRDKDIRIAETQRDTRIKTAAANALAVQGENTSKIDIANSDAQRREKEAEASRIAVAAEKVQAAKAMPVQAPEKSAVAEQIEEKIMSLPSDPEAAAYGMAENEEDAEDEAVPEDDGELASNENSANGNDNVLADDKASDKLLSKLDSEIPEEEEEPVVEKKSRKEKKQEKKAEKNTAKKAEKKSSYQEKPAKKKDFLDDFDDFSDFAGEYDDFDDDFEEPVKETKKAKKKEPRRATLDDDFDIDFLDLDL